MTEEEYNKLLEIVKAKGSQYQLSDVVREAIQFYLENYNKKGVLDKIPFLKK